MKTLPQIAREITDCSLDALRTLIRRTPELRRMGTLYGPTRAYGADEVERIKQAYELRQTAAAK